MADRPCKRQETYEGTFLMQTQLFEVVVFCPEEVIIPRFDRGIEMSDENILDLWYLPEAFHFYIHLKPIAF